MLRRFVIFKQVDMAVPEHSPFRLVISSPGKMGVQLSCCHNN
jgi:hypothetical protein